MKYAAWLVVMVLMMSGCAQLKSGVKYWMPKRVEFGGTQSRAVSTHCYETVPGHVNCDSI